MTGTADQNAEVVCKHCQSTRVRKYGFVEGVQTYFCNDCQKRFKVDDRLYRMKTPYMQVASALDDYYTGKSIGDIRNSLLQHYANCPSSKTIYGWIVKYTDEAVGQFKDYQPKVGDVWLADETVLRVHGKNYWCIDIIDRDTRYVLGTKLSVNRSAKDIQALMEKARDRAGKTPKRVLTDGYKGYLDGIELAYGADSKHIATGLFDTGDNTELIERWHSTLKERTKTLRGLKSIETADRFLDGFLVFYNFLRPHEYLNGKTPAEEAKVQYASKTWADITRVAKPQIQVLTTPAKVDILSERKPLVRPITHRNYDVEKKRRQRKLHKAETRRRPRISEKTPRITLPTPSISVPRPGLPR